MASDGQCEKSWVKLNESRSKLSGSVIKSMKKEQISYRVYPRDYMRFVEIVVEIVLNAIQKVETFTTKTTFKSLRLPEINIRTYIYRIIDSELMSLESVIVSLIYLKKIIHNTPNDFFNQYTVHRLFLTSILLGSKYLDDELYNNREFSILGGIDIKNMNSMELEFLYRIGFELYIKPSEYHYYSYIIRS